ncbi:MAG: hypothetical protein MJ130_08785 [Lachnospiraceae bacterium]|nr:hypothetical protein [Lachnospiraceae bacterium]
MKTNKTNKKGILVFLILLILVLAAVAAFVIYSLKNYTRNNTWIDLEIEVYAGSQGTSGESIVKHEVLTELMAGDVVPIVSGCDFEIIEIHPKGPAVIDVKEAYIHDNPSLDSVQYPKKISLKEGETQMLYWSGEHGGSYSIKLTVTANYYR